MGFKLKDSFLKYDLQNILHKKTLTFIKTWFHPALFSIFKTVTNKNTHYRTSINICKTTCIQNKQEIFFYNWKVLVLWDLLKR